MPKEQADALAEEIQRLRIRQSTPGPVCLKARRVRVVNLATNVNISNMFKPIPFDHASLRDTNPFRAERVFTTPQ
jgi:hypothetical protein